MNHLKILSASVALAMTALGSNGYAATYVGDVYNLGTWSGQIDTQTYTGNNTDSKTWEYENVGFGEINSINTTVATAREPAYFIHKYESETPIGSLEFRYADGYLQEDVAEYDIAYVDFSTDGASWTRIWEMQGTAAWTDYFNTTDWVDYSLPAASTTVYLKHGTMGAYAGEWQMYGSAGNSGVKFAEAIPEPASLAMLLGGGLLMLHRRR